MALDRATFVARRGEFSDVNSGDPERIDAALAAAVRQTDPEIFGDDTDEAVMWLCAHILAADPLGAAARVVGKKAQDTTLYMRERQRLESMYCMAWGAAYEADPSCL